MPIVAVNGAGSMAASTTLTVTPPAGETWAITNLAFGATLDTIYVTTNGSAPSGTQGSPAARYNTSGTASSSKLIPSGPYAITDTSPLKAFNASGGTAGYNYSGVKL